MKKINILGILMISLILIISGIGVFAIKADNFNISKNLEQFQVMDNNNEIVNFNNIVGNSLGGEDHSMVLNLYNLSKDYTLEFTTFNFFINFINNRKAHNLPLIIKIENLDTSEVYLKNLNIATYSNSFSGSFIVSKDIRGNKIKISIINPNKKKVSYNYGVSASFKSEILKEVQEEAFEKLINKSTTTNYSNKYRCYDGTLKEAKLGIGGKLVNPCESINFVISFDCNNNKTQDIYTTGDYINKKGNILNWTQEMFNCKDVASKYNKTGQFDVEDILEIKNKEKNELYKYQCYNEKILNGTFNKKTGKYGNPCQDSNIEINFVCNDRTSINFISSFETFYNYTHINTGSAFWSEYNYPCPTNSLYYMVQLREDIYIENESDINYLYTEYRDYQRIFFLELENKTGIDIIGGYGDYAKKNGKIFMVVHNEKKDFSDNYRFWGVEVDAETAKIIKYKELETDENNYYIKYFLWW